jgi:hypothetical protein
MNIDRLFAAKCQPVRMMLGLALTLTAGAK